MARYSCPKPSFLTHMFVLISVDSLEGLNEENTREYVNLHQFLTQKSLKWPSLNDILYNRDLAATLNTVAKEGAKAFYDGPLARDIVKYVNVLPSYDILFSCSLCYCICGFI